VKNDQTGDEELISIEEDEKYSMGIIPIEIEMEPFEFVQKV
jgi:hypothetical protein